MEKIIAVDNDFKGVKRVFIEKDKKRKTKFVELFYHKPDNFPGITYR